MKIYQPKNGKVLIDDVDLNSIDSKLFRQSISFLPQNLYMSIDTLESNLNTYNRNTPIEANSTMFQLGLEKFYSESNKDELYGPGGINLSGGQKQKINLAQLSQKIQT